MNLIVLILDHYIFYLLNEISINIKNNTCGAACATITEFAANLINVKIISSTEQFPPNLSLNAFSKSFGSALITLNKIEAESIYFLLKSHICDAQTLNCNLILLSFISL